ncbi:MAG: hypothetical protein QXX12_04515 [Nanopusillaceae archaeon]
MFLKEQKDLLNKTYIFINYENLSDETLDIFQWFSNTYDCLFLINNKKVKEIIDFAYELGKKVYGNDFYQKSYTTFFDKNIINSYLKTITNTSNNKTKNQTFNSDLENLLNLFNLFIRKLTSFLHIYNALKDKDFQFLAGKSISNIVKDYYIFIPKITINEKVCRIYFDKFYFQKDEIVKTFFTYIGKLLEWKGSITYIDVKNSLFKFMLDFDINKIANDFNVYSGKSKNGKDLNKKVEKMFFDIRNFFTREIKDMNKKNSNVVNSFVSKPKETNYDYFTLLERINSDFIKEFRKQLENCINSLPFSDVDLFSILSREFQVGRNELKHEFIVFVNKFISKLQKDSNSGSISLSKKEKSLSLSELERMFEDFMDEFLIGSNFKHINIYYNLIKNKLFYYFRISKENSDIQKKFYYDYAKYLWSYQKTLLERFEIKNFRLLYINFDGLIILKL